MDIPRITKIYDEIDGYSIELEADPTVLGPQYLGAIIAKCRNYLNRTTAILLEIRRERQMTANRLAGEKAMFKIESDQLLANDDRVRTRPNIRDREAIINVILKARVGCIHTLEEEIRNLDAIEGAVKVRHTELVRTDGQIKTQRSLIRDELDTKSFYGDEENSRLRTSGVDEDELEAIMSGTPAPTPVAREPSKALFTPPNDPSPVVSELEPVVVSPDPASESISVTESPVDLPVEASNEPEVEPVVEPQVEPAVETAEPAIVDEAPAKTDSVELDVEAALAMAEQAVVESTSENTVIESSPSVSTETSEEEVMNKFLDHEPVKAVKDTKKKTSGRKTAAKEVAEEPMTPLAVTGDPDFDDILAGL